MSIARCLLQETNLKVAVSTQQKWARIRRYRLPLFRSLLLIRATPRAIHLSALLLSSAATCSVSVSVSMILCTLISSYSKRETILGTLSSGRFLTEYVTSATPIRGRCTHLRTYRGQETMPHSFTVWSLIDPGTIRSLSLVQMQ